MQLKIRTLIDSAQALRGLDSSKVSARLSYTLGIVLTAVKPYWEQYDKVNNETLQRLGTPVPDGSGNWNFGSLEAAKQYRDEIDALLNTEVEVALPGRIPLKALMDEGLKLSGSDADFLGWLIKGRPEDGLFEVGEAAEERPEGE